MTKASPYNDTTVVANTTYYYAVEATDTGQDTSPMSAPVKVTTPAEPAAPTNVRATANSSTQITVTWSETIPPNGMPTVSSYTIYGAPASTGPWTKLGVRTTLSYSQTGLTPGDTYYYYITATDSGGDISPASATVNATTP